MKRRREQDEDPSELLQLVRNQAEGTSSDGDNHRVPKLERKHKIFLSHSGVQKDFTEQLCVDLERSKYYPFFDKRPNSLPKGRKFPELILKAAQQCRVAVLILSEDFFTNSKWPMLELEVFVEAQKKDPKRIAILPVYLRISRDECTKNEARQLRWVSVWRKWAESGDRINVANWVKALRVLGSSNGIEYVQSLGEVTLRKQIVSAIWGLVPPEITWSVGPIEGRDRICKAIREKIQSTNPSALYGVQVVGIHGTGGVGKTTFCKVLCDELFTEFEGKVCHGELGSRSPIELQKQVVRDLSDMSCLTHLYDDNRITNLLSFRQHQVFLALDNVSQESLEEAQVFLRAGFHPESIVMVTARSIELLARLNIERSSCMEMLELEEEDAKHLFLHHAAPRVQFHSEADKEDVLKCVRQCKFSKGGEKGVHFHPLALKVLGAQLKSLERDPKKWVENLENLPRGDKFNQFGEEEHPIFSVLRRGYDSLLEKDKFLFIDVVLLCPYLISESSSIHHKILEYGVGRYILGWCQSWSSINIFEWLSIVHKANVWSIKNRLQVLKAKALLENIGDYSVCVHDLYIEFAKMEVIRGGMDIKRWVWYDQEEPDREDFALTPSGKCWQNVKRVHMYKWRDIYETMRWSGDIEGIKWQHFSNTVVLNLFIKKFEVLDLRGLQCLRSLGLECDKDLDKDLENKGGKLIGLAELKKLSWLHLCNIGSASYFDEIGSLTLLEVLQLREDNFHSREPLSPPKLDKCIALRELVLRGYKNMRAFPDLSNLTSLRMVIFEDCNEAEEVTGLNSKMRSLRIFMVGNCPSLRHIYGLGDLVSLEELDIENCIGFEQLPNLRNLSNLQRVILVGEFKKVLGFNESMPVYNLELDGVEELHDWHWLRCLQRLSIWRFLGSMLPDFSRFTMLEEIYLSNLEKVRELPSMHKLSRLRKLIIDEAPKLELQLPMLGGLVALEELQLERCGTSVGRAQLPDLHTLTYLQDLSITYTPIRSIPSLQCLTQLRIFVCRSTPLVELPDLSGLILLHYLSLSECYELTSVGNLAILPALQYLNVFWLSQVREVARSQELRETSTPEAIQKWSPSLFR